MSNIVTLNQVLSGGTGAPPSYAETVKGALGAGIGKAIEDPVASDAAQQELKLMLKSPEVTSTAAQEIAHLTQTVRDIRAANRKIRTDLFNFDKAEFRDKRGQHVQLGPKWDTFSKVS